MPVRRRRVRTVGVWMMCAENSFEDRVAKLNSQIEPLSC